MALWGVITIFIGASRTYHATLILRFFLGFIEAAFFPGAVFLLSRWYKRNELGLRTALFDCGNSISYAFSTLAASGILAGLDGTLGVPAWRSEAIFASSKDWNWTDLTARGGSSSWRAL